MTAAFTQDDLDAINTAIKSGATTVKYGDKEVTYRSLSEMMRVRDLIRRDLGLTNSSQRVTATFRKGLCDE